MVRCALWQAWPTACLASKQQRSGAQPAQQVHKAMIAACSSWLGTSCTGDDEGASCYPVLMRSERAHPCRADLLISSRLLLSLHHLLPDGSKGLLMGCRRGRTLPGSRVHLGLQVCLLLAGCSGPCRVVETAYQQGRSKQRGRMQSDAAGLGWLQRPLQTEVNSRSVRGMLREAEDQHNCSPAVQCAAGVTRHSCAYKVVQRHRLQAISTHELSMLPGVQQE